MNQLKSSIVVACKTCRYCAGLRNETAKQIMKTHNLASVLNAFGKTMLPNVAEWHCEKSAFTQSDDLAMNVNKVGNLDE